MKLRGWLALGFVLVACGGDEFAGDGGASVGGSSGGGGVAGSSGGGNAGTFSSEGGASGSGLGGSDAGSGGSNAGAGGSDAGSGGSDAGAGGSTAGASGSAGAGGGSVGGEAGAGGSGGMSGTSGQGGNAAGAGGAGVAGAAGSGNAGGPAGGAGGGGGAAGGGGGPVPIQIVQATDTKLSQLGSPTLTMPAMPAQGHAIIVGITCISDFGEIPGDVGGDCVIPNTGGVTDNQGNTYTRAIQGEAILSSQQGARGYIFIAHGVSISNPGSFTLQVAPNGSGTAPLQSMALGAIEVAGLAPTPSLDASGSSLVGGTDKTSTSITTDLATTQPNELAIAVLSMRSDDTNMLITPEATWTQHHIHQNNASGPPGHSMISKLLSATGKVSHTWTHDNPTRGVAAVIATFKGASSGNPTN